MGCLSFGLSPNDKEAVILEPIFLLMYHGGFSYTEGYNIPVAYKRWFIDRIGRELKGSEGQEESGMPQTPKTPSGNQAARQIRKF